MNVEKALSEFIKKFGVKCYIFCDDKKGIVANAIIGENKFQKSKFYSGILELTEYVFLFSGNSDVKQFLKKSGHILANNHRYMVSNYSASYFMGKLFCIKAICREEDLL